MMAKKASVEKKSKRTCYSVVIVPQYEGRAHQFKVSRLAIYSVITVVILFFSGFAYAMAQNTQLKNTVAQYNGMGLDQVVRLQATQLDAANEAISTSKTEVTALKKYVDYQVPLMPRSARRLASAGPVSLWRPSSKRRPRRPFLSAVAWAKLQHSCRRRPRSCRKQPKLVRRTLSSSRTRHPSTIRSLRRLLPSGHCMASLRRRSAGVPTPLAAAAAKCMTVSTLQLRTARRSARRQTARWNKSAGTVPMAFR